MSAHKSSVGDEEFFSGRGVNTCEEDLIVRRYQIGNIAVVPINSTYVGDTRGSLRSIVGLPNFYTSNAIIS